jgi:hypothetical protein
MKAHIAAHQGHQPAALDFRHEPTDPLARVSERLLHEQVAAGPSRSECLPHVVAGRAGNEHQVRLPRERVLQRIERVDGRTGPSRVPPFGDRLGQRRLPHPEFEQVAQVSPAD